ncbi:methyl-accepting chemotaxis protein [Chitinimonas naiadis]
MRNNQPITDTQRHLDPKRPVVTKTDLKSHITYANPAFVEISGFTAQELIGQPHNIVRHPSMPSAAFADMWQTIQSGRPWQAVVKNRCKDGGHYWVEAYATPITENGHRVGYMSVRSAPTAAQVAEAERLYQQINAGTSPFPATPAPPRWRFGWLLAAAVALPVILALALNAFSVTLWLTAPVLLMVAAALYYATLQATARPIAQALEAIQHLSEGNFKQHVNTQGLREFNHLLTGLESMRVNLRAIMADAVSAADQVGKQAQDLGKQTAGLTERSHQQADGVASVASALEQLAVAVGEISDATDRGASHADAARSVTRRGVAQMDEAQRATDRVFEVVQGARNTIGELEQAVSQIGAVTQTIKDIAEQTNLLALNAAIEAARAGEQGRGFAVVADEVRKLSERTAESTRTISGTISDVQVRTVAALRSMDDAATAVEEGKSRIAGTRDSLGEIDQATAGVAQAAHEVASVLNQQSQASHEVAGSMERMSALTEQNGASIDQVAASAQELAVVAEDLHKLLHQFERSL